MDLGGKMATENLTELQRKYCITQCKYGKVKMEELLHSCESVFDAVADMQLFAQNCSRSSICPFNKNVEKEC